MAVWIPLRGENLGKFASVCLKVELNAVQSMCIYVPICLLGLGTSSW